MDATSKDISEKPDPSAINDLYSDDKDVYDKKKYARTRRVKHDKKKKVTRKKKARLEQKLNQYDNVLLDQMIKEFAETKSPHVILSNKTFNDIKLNTIMLTRPRIENVSNNRNIFYDIKWMGDNVKMKVNGKNYHINLSSCKRNIIFILAAIHEMNHIDNLIFFTEKGEMIPNSCLDTNRYGYVLLSCIQIEKKWQTKNILMTESRLAIAEKFYINQIKQKHGNYHFGTSGTIYGLGYGPKFHRNEHGHSIDRYSNSKFILTLFFHILKFFNL